MKDQDSLVAPLLQVIPHRFSVDGEEGDREAVLINVLLLWNDPVEEGCGPKIKPQQKATRHKSLPPYAIYDTYSSAHAQRKFPFGNA